MSDEDEMEDFDVNDEDLRRAMDPSYRNKSTALFSFICFGSWFLKSCVLDWLKGNKMSREDAMLGVFASRHDSDEEDYGNNDAEILKSFSFGDRRTSKKSGINFVSKSSASQKEKPAKDKREPMIVSICLFFCSWKVRVVRK